jgi:hypothetical protein
MGDVDNGGRNRGRSFRTFLTPLDHPIWGLQGDAYDFMRFYPFLKF